jgi:hypothetical protein
MNYLRHSDLHLAAALSCAILAVNAASVSARVGFVHKAKRTQETDHFRYIEMAKGPDGDLSLQREPPYCWRVAVPFMARVLTRTGLSLNAAFYALTNATLFGFLLVMWLSLRDLGFDRSLRVTGLLLLGFTQGAVRWFEYQYWMTDIMAVFLVALALLLLRRRRDLSFGATSIFAAFVRETYVVVFPVFFLRKLREGMPLGRAILRTIAVTIVPAGIYVALRVLIHPNQPDDYVAGIVDSMAFRLRHLGDNQPYVLTVGTYGVMFPLVLLFPSRLPGLVRRHYDLAAMLLAVGATLTISNNTERPLAYSLPVVLPVALVMLRAFIDLTRLPRWPVLTLVVGLQLLFWWRHRFAEMGMSLYQPTNLGTVLAMAAFYAVAQILILRARRRSGILGTASAT